MAKKLLKLYAFTPGVGGVGNILLPGKFSLEDLLLITNVTKNAIIYNFGSPEFIGTTAVYTAGEHSAFPNLLQKEAGFTTITLAYDTSTHSATDKIQIFIEDTQDGVKIRPWDFGTDAIERMRVSNPQSMIDADFEYGLQPTKWAGYGTIRGYPSTYELPGIDLTVTAVTSDYNATSSTNSVITVTFDAAHGISVGQVIGISSLSPAVTGFSRAAGNFIVNSVPSSTTITYFARGIVGTFNGQSLFITSTLAKRGALYSVSEIVVKDAVSSGANPSVMTVNFNAPHGLLPGTQIYANVGSGSFANLATGPFVITSVPTQNSFIYTARTGAAVAAPALMNVYAFNSSSITHRPQDGGVILETGTPTYGAVAVRQTKKYFRYQSGKGYMWSTGTLFKPNYDIQSITSSGLGIGSIITITTDNIDHGLQVGAVIRIPNVLTSGYNGTYTVNSIVSDYSFTVVATQNLGATSAVLDIDCRVYIVSWVGACVRAGLFDDQNGLFWECDGNRLYVVRRSSTMQVTGSITATLNSSLITGTSTRFTQQLKAGDKIMIRGMTHFISYIADNTTAYITPDYRGVTATGIKASMIRELRIPQSEFNVDTIDGNGPSGYNIDLNKMQMMALQFSWYGAGFIDYMVRGADGNFIVAHRIKNNNVNDESYMRSGNLPVRYSIENDCPVSFLTNPMDSTQNTIPIKETKFFPNTGIVYIDNEIISYNGKSTYSGTGNLTNAVRNFTMSQYQAGSTYNLTAGANVAHSAANGVIMIQTTCSPTLNHWGSALILDGGYDEERGYLFNYQRINMPVTTTAQTAFVIRLAPSVENSQIGPLGSRTLLNRSQLLLEQVGIAISGGSTSPAVGNIIIEGILNPKNFSNATWTALNTESVGGQPSFAQVSQSVIWSTIGAGPSSGVQYAIPGEQVFAFAGQATTSGAVNDRLDIGQLKELTGAPLGGDFKYPDGSDVLAINIRTTQGSANAALVLRWSEAQA
jgi:hypothetical protein